MSHWAGSSIKEMALCIKYVLEEDKHKVMNIIGINRALFFRSANKNRQKAITRTMETDSKRKKGKGSKHFKLFYAIL